MKLIKLTTLFMIILSLTACTIDGEQGIQGIQGIEGEQGVQGIEGEQGLQGIQGEQGEPGVQGEQGLQGEVGMQGDNGLSAYGLWLLIPGNEGKTETEFFESLVGTVDISIVEQLQSEIDHLKLNSDIIELKIWLNELPETFTSGDMFPYMDIPSLSYYSIVTGVEHTFDYNSDNGDFTVTVTYEDVSQTLNLSYEVMMNQAEIDAMNLHKATEDAAELQAWLDGLQSVFMHDDIFPSYPVLTNGSNIVGPTGLVFDYFAQNGAINLTVQYNGQTASASRTFIVDENFQQLVNQDAQFLQSWLNSLTDEFADGDTLPNLPILPNGSTITSGFPHEFNYGIDEVILELENEFATASASRVFNVSLF